MSDMLVKLYELPSLQPVLDEVKSFGIEVRRALPVERNFVVQWVRKSFSESWASECAVSFSRQPVACFIAVQEGDVVGFACYDSCFKNFFGPEGVSQRVRGKGVGKALVLCSMHAMAAEGYGYAIIGWAGPVEFYKRILGATVIENSEPGVYRGLLKSAVPPEHR